MKEPKLFIYMLLLVLLMGSQRMALAQTKRDPKTCEGFNVSIEKTDSKPVVNEGGTLEVRTSGGSGTMKFHLIEKTTGVLVSRDRGQRVFTNLKKGTYTIVVTDNAGCSSEKEFTIR